MHALTGAQMDAQFLSSRAQGEPSISPTRAIVMILVTEISKTSTMGNGGHRRCGIVLIEFFVPTCTKTVQLARKPHAISAALGRERSIAQCAHTPAPKALGR
jgi:hypothetical protein